MWNPKNCSLWLPTLLLAGVLIGLPWAGGGRSPIGQVSLILVLAVAGIAGVFAHRLSALTSPSPLLFAAAVLAAVSALHTIYPDRTIQSLILLVAYLLAGVLAAEAARESPRLEDILLVAILTSGTLVTVVGMIRLLYHSDEGLYARLLTGPFQYPNAMAGFLLLVGGAALVAARGERGPAGRIAATAIIILVLFGLALTRSRGAWLAAGTGLLIVVVMEWRRRWPAKLAKRLALCLCGCGLLAMLAWVSWILTGPLPILQSLANRPEFSSFVWRWRILQWTWAMAWDHPWWGVGPGAFPVALTNYQRIPYVSGENPHNLYLQLAAEYGLPAAILGLTTVGVFLARIGKAIRQTPDSKTIRWRSVILLGTITAFAMHSFVDLDWSFPAIAVTVATMIGLASAQLPRMLPWRLHARPVGRMGLIMLLVLVAFMAITRYYASALVTWGQLALASREATLAWQDLAWALRLNPLSSPAHQWMAWARLLSGDSRGAAEVAERAIRIAPSDPNSHYLAGEIAAASGDWRLAEERFQAAVDLSPATQLRFHSALVESAANAGRIAEARFRHERAIAIFTEERVLNAEARCVVPGDRYLLARMNRAAARASGNAGDYSSQQRILERAALLARPDMRGICVNGGRPGQTSPEAAVDSFWRALADGGWQQAEPFLSPELRATQSHVGWNVWEKQGRLQQVHLGWIAALNGGEPQTSLRFEIQFEVGPGTVVSRCAQADVRLIKNNWFVDKLPVIEPAPCQL